MTIQREDETIKTQAACLNRIYSKVKSSGLNGDSLEELRDDIDYVSGVYTVDSTGAALLAAILERSTGNRALDDEDLAQYFGCSNIEFISYRKMLREMDKAGIIQIYEGRGGRRCYRVSSEMMKAVENNGEFHPVKMTGLTAEEFFGRFRKLFESYMDDAFDVEQLLDELDCLVRYNDHLSFCRKALESVLYSDCSDTERRMFYFICHSFVTLGNKSVDIDKLTSFSGYMESNNSIKRRIAGECMTIQRSGLVGFAIEDGFVDTSALSLSDKVKEEFLSEVVPAPEEAIRHRDLINVDSIQAKELFYNEAEGAQVARLEQLLDGENFREVQTRLQATGMRKGFNAIFYGAPGTGKTASVYEIARRTGRDIFRVDMAKLKSKWVGDSEKSVRGVFRFYRSLCKGRDKAPILLFNEADAIFSKRIENVEHSVDQTNNAVQNIILEEMENIDGILIATTNLLANLDPAFERRFIYKVEFKMPEKDSRAKIWKSMIPSLSEEDATILAGKYAFAGGNIENIARKSTVEYVLSGNEPTLSSLEGYCQEEILSRKDKRNRIGF